VSDETPNDVEIRYLTKAVDRLVKKVSNGLSTDVASIKTHIKIQWWFLGATFISIVAGCIGLYYKLSQILIASPMAGL